MGYVVYIRTFFVWIPAAFRTGGKLLAGCCVELAERTSSMIISISNLEASEKLTIRRHVCIREGTDVDVISNTRKADAKRATCLARGRIIHHSITVQHAYYWYTNKL